VIIALTVFVRLVMVVVLVCSSLFVLRLGFLCVYHYPLLLSGRVVLYELCTFATQEHFGGFADFGSGVKMFPSSQIVPCDTEVALSVSRFCA